MRDFETSQLRIILPRLSKLSFLLAIRWGFRTFVPHYHTAMDDKPILSSQNIDELLQLLDQLEEEQVREYMSLLSISDGLAYIRNHSEHKAPYATNVFERYNSDEPTTSWAMAEILKFKDAGTYPLLHSFMEHFLVPIGFNIQWIDHPVITVEKDRIDVCVKDNKYALIFENKIKGANYQPNQIARYIYKLHHLMNKSYGKNNLFIVLMPTSHEDDYIQNIPQSVWRLPSDYKKPKNEQRCVIAHDLCWCDYRSDEWEKQWNAEFCKSCIKTFKKDYEPHTLVLQQELSEWLLKDCLKLVPPKEIILKSFIIQFADFLNLQYGTRENQKLKREMEKYLREKLFDTEKSNLDNWNIINDKLDEIRKLEDEVGLLLESISGDVIDDWYHELLPEWKCYGLKHEKQDNFTLNVRGVLIGCWSGKGVADHQPYWGFYSEKGFTAKQCHMIEAILEKTNMNGYVKEKNEPWYWKSTCNGTERCNDFYNAAIELGYLEKQSNEK